MSFYEINDFLRESIENRLPPQKAHTGRPRSDLRKLMNVILYVIQQVVSGKMSPVSMVAHPKTQNLLLEPHMPIINQVSDFENNSGNCNKV
jgi:transposase